MGFADLGHKVQKFAIDNSPGILTAIGVAGTVTTAYLTGRATFRAADILFEEERRRSESVLPVKPVPPTGKEQVKLVWKLYIPAIGTGIITVGCIFGANHIGTRRAAAVAAAYSISEKAFAEYKDKVVEKIGATKEQAVRDEIAQDRVNRTPGASEIIVSGNEVRCFDGYSGRYFSSNMEAIKKAMNDTNYQINSSMYASLTDFYNKLGLAPLSMSDEVGWNTDKLMDIEFSTTLDNEGKPCLSIDFTVTPVRDYFRLH